MKLTSLRMFMKNARLPWLGDLENGIDVTSIRLSEKKNALTMSATSIVIAKWLMLKQQRNGRLQVLPYQVISRAGLWATG